MNSSNISRAPALIVEPSSEHRNSVLWLHGLGATADDFHGLLPTFSLAHFSSFRWIFPNACVQPVTLNCGLAMPSWFDIISLTPDWVVNVQDVEQTCDYVHSLMKEEKRRFSDEINRKMYVVGFSQGGVVALHAGILAVAHGVVDHLSVLGLSCCHPYVREVLNQLSQNQLLRVKNGLRVHLMHGVDDEVISVHLGHQCVDVLSDFDMAVTWKSYEMGHQVCSQQLNDIVSFFVHS